MRPPRRLVLTAAAVVLASLACSGDFGAALQPEPVPPDKLDYVGTWEDPPITLTITADGMCHYQKSGNGTNTSINAPIQSWADNGLAVGIGPMTTFFVVDEPPHEDGGAWKMTVDGRELVRQ